MQNRVIIKVLIHEFVKSTYFRSASSESNNRRN